MPIADPESQPSAAGKPPRKPKPPAQAGIAPLVIFDFIVGGLALLGGGFLLTARPVGTGVF